MGSMLALCAQDPVFRGGINLVDVLAVVRDRRGMIVNDLQQSDFRVFEDGKEQQVRKVVRQTDLPLTIGMLVDVSGSVANEIPEERRAALQFFQQVLRREDRAFVMGFSGEATLLADTTGDKEKLEDALWDLESAIVSPQRQRRIVGMNQFPFPGGNGGNNWPFPFPVPGTTGPTGPQRNPGVGGGRNGGGRNGDERPVPVVGGTVLYDAVYLAANDVMTELDGRKVIILLTDGEDHGSRMSLTSAIDAAVRADTLIYSIFVSHGDKQVLQRFSDKTGGRVFELEGPRSLQRIFGEIEEELRSQYAISYSPSNENFDGSYRQIEVRVNKRDHKVRARDGYYAMQRDRSTGN
jgi:VWFA-related protein